jgi:uncharacterized protein (DUF1015 family)
MATIFPFSGLRYNLERVQSLSGVISPPYDKISPEERQIFWARHEYNVARLILPPPDETETDYATQAADSGAGDWYSSAAQRFQSWIDAGLLVADTPRFYVYRQTFSYLDRTYTRVGLFVSLRLDDRGGPLAHEHTFEGPKADRFRLLSASKANLSPIFLLADGGMPNWDAALAKTDEILTRFDDPDGQTHELQSISDPGAIQFLQDFVQQRILVIADGHHRYETAQNYKRKMMETTGNSPEGQPWGSVMALIVPAESPDLLVLPTHRVISQMPEGWMDTLLSQAGRYGTIEPLPDYSGASLRRLLSQPDRRESIAVAGPQNCFLITLNSSSVPPSLLAIDEALRRLNVCILHQFLLESCLQLTPADLQGVTRYIRGEEEAISRVHSGTAQAAFLLGGLSPQTVLDISQHNVRMPQKSTDFYPKIPTGLIFRSVESTE